MDGGNDVARIVEAAEDAGDVRTLCLLHLIHQAAHVIGDGIHPQGVESAIEHVGLYAGLVEGLAEGAHGLVGVLSGQQVHLLEGTTVGLHASETSHIDDGGCHACQLILTGLEFTRRLPHIAVDKTESDFLLHNTKMRLVNGNSTAKVRIKNQS